jgi:hypothetical protein
MFPPFTSYRWLTNRSERGVVFFRDAIITPEEQKDLVDALGRLGGKPESSRLHVHPLTLAGSELGDEISVISNHFVFDDKFKRDDFGILDRVQGKTLWVCPFSFVTVEEELMGSTLISPSKMFLPITLPSKSARCHP